MRIPCVIICWANGPEKKDADFSWREFVNSPQRELLRALAAILVEPDAGIYPEVPGRNCPLRYARYGAGGGTGEAFRRYGRED